MKNVITIYSKPHDVLTGPVFAGQGQLLLDNKKIKKFIVSNQLEAGKEYECRSIGKCKAGWNVIQDFKCKADGLWQMIGKSTQYVEVKNSFGNWVMIYAVKGKHWEFIDGYLLDICTVGDIRQSCNAMASHNIWDKVNAKTWGDLAFVPNPKNRN